MTCKICYIKQYYNTSDSDPQIKPKILLKIKN